MHIRHSVCTMLYDANPYMVFRFLDQPYSLYLYDIVRPNLNLDLTNNQQYFWRIRVELQVFNLLIVKEATT